MKGGVDGRRALTFAVEDLCVATNTNRSRDSS